MPEIKNIIFDVGNVLLIWDPQAIAVKAFPDKSDAALCNRIFYSPIWMDLDVGRISLDEAIQKYQSYLGFPSQDFANFKKSIFESYIPVLGSLELLNDVHHLGMNLYCISNCIEETYGFLRNKYDFFDKFKDIAVSCYFGSIKPDLQFFLYLCQRNNLFPEETIFIDDQLKNIEAAKSLNMHTIHFRDSTACRAELEKFLNRAV